MILPKLIFIIFIVLDLYTPIFQVLRIGMSTHRTLPTDKNWSRKRRGRRMTSAMKSSKRTHQRLDRWNSAAKLAVARALFPSWALFLLSLLGKSFDLRTLAVEWLEHRWEVGGGYGWLIPQLKVAACAGVPEGHLLQSRGKLTQCPLPLGPAWSRLVQWRQPTWSMFFHDKLLEAHLPG